MIPSQVTRVITKLIEHNQNFMLTGKPGVSKTSLVEQACEAMNVRCITFHPVTMDPSLITGLPWIVKSADMTVEERKAAGFKATEKGKVIAEFIAIGKLKDLISEAAKGEKIVAFFDDLGQAAPMMQAACMHLFLAKRAGDHELGDNIVFGAATNRKEDKAGVSHILEPVKSRFTTIIDVEPDVQDWVLWAMNHSKQHPDDYIPIEVIGFVKFKGLEILDGFKPTGDMTNTPTPRTIHHVARIVRIGFDPDDEFDVIKGAAGDGFATEFVGFLKIYRNLPDMGETLRNPDKVDLSKYSMDMKWAFTTSISSHLNVDKNDPKFTLAKNFFKIITKWLEKDLQVVAVMYAVSRLGTAFSDVPEYSEWVRENSEIVMPLANDM